MALWLKAQIKTASMDGASNVDIKATSQKLMDIRLQTSFPGKLESSCSYIGE